MKRIISKLRCVSVRIITNCARLTYCNIRKRYILRCLVVIFESVDFLCGNVETGFPGSQSRQLSLGDLLSIGKTVSSNSRAIPDIQFSGLTNNRNPCSTRSLYALAQVLVEADNLSAAFFSGSDNFPLRPGR